MADEGATNAVGHDEMLDAEQIAGQSVAIVDQPEDASSAAASHGHFALPAPANATQEPTSAAPEAMPAPPAPQPPAAAPWSSEDESLFQTLLVRRKAAGHRRGRDVSDQRICLGSIKPNPNTIVAIIVGLISERGTSVSRDELITAMASATFPHPKAQPSDRGWCQGYVAGAIRNGFLALESTADQAEAA